MPVVLIAGALDVLFVAPLLGFLALAGVALYLTGGRRDQKKGERSRRLRLAGATVAAWLALAIVWFMALLSATVGGEMHI